MESKIKSTTQSIARVHVARFYEKYVHDRETESLVHVFFLDSYVPVLIMEGT